MILRPPLPLLLQPSSPFESTAQRTAIFWRSKRETPLQCHPLWQQNHEQVAVLNSIWLVSVLLLKMRGHSRQSGLFALFTNPQKSTRNIEVQIMKSSIVRSPRSEIATRVKNKTMTFWDFMAKKSNNQKVTFLRLPAGAAASPPPAAAPPVLAHAFHPATRWFKMIEKPLAATILYIGNTSTSSPRKPGKPGLFIDKHLHRRRRHRRRRHRRHHRRRRQTWWSQWWSFR